MTLDELVLMPEVRARRVLRGDRLRLSVLTPVGAYAGRGALRVLRARAFEGTAQDAVIDLTCGYESYVRLDPGFGGDRVKT